jgi:hypothetical protein
MLCQLVCVDRRYQRMNCFNIRELQGILKRKFFTDLVNSNDHRDLFDKSIIGLRFKNNNQLNINHDMSLFYNFGTTNSAKAKYTLFGNNYSDSSNFSKTQYIISDLFLKLSEYIISSTNSLLTLNNGGFLFFFSKFSLVNTNALYNLVSNTLNMFKELICIPFHITSTSLTTFLNLPRFTNEFIAMNFALNFYNTPASYSSKIALSNNDQNSTLFTSENMTNLDSLQTFSSSMSEVSTSLRFTRFNNPLISYDYKCGNYLGI